MVLDFDEVLPHIGEWGKYQKLLFWLICVPACIPCAFHGFNQVFLGAIPPHWCTVPQLIGFTDELQKNMSVPLEEQRGEMVFSQCLMYDVNYEELVEFNHTWYGDPSWNSTTCKYGWNYDHSNYEATAVTEWNLVCDEDYMSSLAYTIYSVGNLIGNFLFGFIQDRTGRKKAFFACLTLQTVFGIATAFAPDFVSFTIFRFFVGLTIPQIFVIPFVIAIELVGPSKRGFVTLVQCCAYTTGLLILSGVAYLVRNWRHLALATSIPFLYMYVYWWFLPESSRWLLANNKIDQCEELVQKAAKTNKKNIGTNLILQLMKRDEEDKEKLVSESEQITYTVLDLFRTPNLRKKTILISFIWFVNVSVYVGLSLYIPILGNSDYLNFFISSAVEMLSYPILWVVIDRWGRRWPLCLSMLLGGVACTVTVLLPAGQLNWIISLSIIGKFGISTSHVMIYLFAGEIFPTVVRGLGIGFSEFCGSAGAIASPFVAYLGYEYQKLPVFGMGIVMLIAGLLSLALPETLNENLPETIEEAENFGKGQPFLNCGCKKKQGQGNNVNVESGEPQAVDKSNTAKKHEEESMNL